MDVDTDIFLLVILNIDNFSIVRSKTTIISNGISNYQKLISIAMTLAISGIKIDSSSNDVRYI